MAPLVLVTKMQSWIWANPNETLALAQKKIVGFLHMFRLRIMEKKFMGEFLRNV